MTTTETLNATSPETIHTYMGSHAHDHKNHTPRLICTTVERGGMNRQQCSFSFDSSSFEGSFQLVFLEQYSEKRSYDEWQVTLYYYSDGDMMTCYRSQEARDLALEGWQEHILPNVLSDKFMHLSPYEELSDADRKAMTLTEKQLIAEHDETLFAPGEHVWAMADRFIERFKAVQMLVRIG